jgi:hypothetical protein
MNASHLGHVSALRLSVPTQMDIYMISLLRLFEVPIQTTIFHR